MAHVIPTRVPREVVLFRQVAPSGGVASFDITGIPADCDLIRIYLQGKSEASNSWPAVRIAFNADTTAANYRAIRGQLYDSNIAVATGDVMNIGFFGESGHAMYIGQIRAEIVNPASTTFYKTLTGTTVERDNGAASYNRVQNIHTGLVWESAAAINRITLTVVDFNSGVASDFAEGTLCLVTAIRNT